MVTRTIFLPLASTYLHAVQMLTRKQSNGLSSLFSIYISCYISCLSYRQMDQKDVKVVCISCNRGLRFYKWRQLNWRVVGNREHGFQFTHSFMICNPGQETGCNHRRLAASSLLKGSTSDSTLLQVENMLLPLLPFPGWHAPGPVLSGKQSSPRCWASLYWPPPAGISWPRRRRRSCTAACCSASPSGRSRGRSSPWSSPRASGPGTSPL